MKKTSRSLAPLAAALGAVFAGYAGLASAQTLSGVVVGHGYYAGAKVCLDLNSNARCDAGEPFTVSDANGNFTLSIAGGNAAVVAEVPVGASVGGKAVTRAITLRAPLQSNTVVGPLSTEVQAYIDAGSDFTTASNNVAGRVGVSPVQLLEDPNTEANGATQALLLRESDQLLDRLAYAVSEAGKSGNLVMALRNRLDLDQITNVVVIYAENRSFDNLFGAYPGANGLGTAAAKAIHQKDRDGSTNLSMLPPAWGGLTAAGQVPAVTQAQTTNVWPNAPFQIDNPVDLFGYGTLTNAEVTRDLYHRFYENQMQINGGKNDQYAAWGDSGGVVMGYFDGSKTQLWGVAQKNTLADNFFQAAYGGSFLNHQYLVCACAPSIPAAVVTANGMTVTKLGAPVNGVPQLALAATNPASALNGAPKFVLSGNIAPLDYFGTGDGYRGINTMQPAYQPSGNKPADNNGNDALYANPAAATTVPPQTQTNIGDLLDQKSVSWAWFSGGWNAASSNPYPWNGSTFGTSTTIYNTNASGTSDSAHSDFQAHHQPFNYFASMDPVANPAYRAAHLKDEADLLAAAASGSLPAVSFYKPVGFDNQHPGYTNVSEGDVHMAQVIQAIQNGPQGANTLILLTYDEFGGQFDHVAPPKGDLIGPGTRIPAIIIGKYAKKGYVDHTPYDTVSALRFITHRYSLPVLPGLQVRDAAVSASIGRPLGDLTNALNFAQ